MLRVMTPYTNQGHLSRLVRNFSGRSSCFVGRIGRCRWSSLVSVPRNYRAFWTVVGLYPKTLSTQNLKLHKYTVESLLRCLCFSNLHIKGSSSKNRCIKSFWQRNLSSKFNKSILISFFPKVSVHLNPCILQFVLRMSLEWVSKNTG